MTTRGSVKGRAATISTAHAASINDAIIAERFYRD